MGWSVLNYVRKNRNEPTVEIGEFLVSILREYLVKNGRTFREDYNGKVVRLTTISAAAQLFGAESVAAVASSPQVSELLRDGLTTDNPELAKYQRGAFLHTSKRPSCLVPGVSGRPRAIPTRGRNTTHAVGHPAKGPQHADTRGYGGPESGNGGVRAAFSRARAHARAVEASPPRPVRGGGGGRDRVAAWWAATHASGGRPT